MSGRNSVPIGLTQDELERGTRILARRLTPFRSVVRSFGTPPMWERTAGFPTLLHIILEQQVSLASARAVMAKLTAAAKLTPGTFLRWSDEELKRFGFSGQKGRYGRELALAVIDGSLDFDALHALHDDDVRERLTRITGIGRWTADVYLLMVLLRPDVWPSGDLALASSAHKIFGLEARPTYRELDEMSDGWRPWRSVAARLLWHDYLSRR